MYFVRVLNFQIINHVRIRIHPISLRFLSKSVNHTRKIQQIEKTEEKQAKFNYFDYLLTRLTICESTESFYLNLLQDSISFVSSVGFFFFFKPKGLHFVVLIFHLIFIFSVDWLIAANNTKTCDFCLFTLTQMAEKKSIRIKRIFMM